MKKQFGCIVALKSPAHITLIPPFWFDEDKEARLIDRVHSFKGSLPAIEIELNGFQHFRKKVLFINIIGNSGLHQLKNEVEKYFLQTVTGYIKSDRRPFHPHITIANRDMKPSHFEKAWEYFSGKEYKELFSINAISLLKLDSGKWNNITSTEWFFGQP